MLQFLLFVGFTSMSVQGQLSVTWNGSLVTGPVLIFLDELLVDDYKSSTIGNTGRPGALVCRSEGRARVSWHYVDGSIVSDAPRTDLSTIIQTRTGAGVTPSISRLSLGIEGFASNTGRFNGIWHCRLNAMGDGTYEVEINIGIYSRQARLGIINVGESGVSLGPPPSSIPLNFTLYGDSVGGPPTDYSWSRNGVAISNGGPYDISIGVNKASFVVYTRSVYRSALTVTGDFPGQYTYHFTNRVSPQFALSSTEIQRGTAPTFVQIRQIGQFRVDVAWIANAPLPQFGFEVTVQPGDFSVIAELADVPVSFTISSGSVGEFRAEVRALFYPLPSEIVGANTTVLGVLPPLVTELVVTDTVARAVWTQPPFSFSPFQNQYFVLLERATGSEQVLCPDVVDSRRNTTTFNITYTQLHEFSLYRLTITANFSFFEQSDTLSTVVTFSTDSAVPTGAPGGVAASTASRNLTMSWHAIKCSERNGVITNYIVEFGQRSGATVNIGVTNQTFVAIGLTPHTKYTFRVAGSNSIGRGPFSCSKTVTTDEEVPGVVSSLVAEVVFTSVVITWRAPREPNGVIIAYEVTYSVDNQNLRTVNVTGSSTSLILPLRLEAEVSNISVLAYTSIGSGPGVALNQNVPIPKTPVPPVVDEVLAEVLDSTTVNVSWKSVTVPGIVNYTVYYRPREGTLEDGGSLSVTVPSSESSVVIRNLMTAVEYQFEVVVIAMLEMELLVGERSIRAIALPLSFTTPPIPATNSLSTLERVGLICGSVFILAVVTITIFILVVKKVKHKRHLKSEKLEKLKSDEAYKVATIVGAPEILEFPSDDIYAVERECVYFNVAIQGKPQPLITWYHDDIRLEPDSNVSIQLDGSMCISSACLKHSGMYKLCVSNTKGSAERKIRLTVLHEYEESTITEFRDLVSIPDPVPVAKFGEYVATGHANSNMIFRLQFNSLETGDKHPKTIGTQKKNKKFNRFGNVTVYDNNRIILKPLVDFEKCEEEFINACYIQGYSVPDRFIATLGPKKYMLIDFWRLVWQERPPTIVMVTNLKEGRKTKCDQYWPEDGSCTYGPFTVVLTGKLVLCDYSIRTMTVTCENIAISQRLKLTHYQYTAWPERGVPEFPTSMLSFVRMINSEHRRRKRPILIHCSAGIGRTGVFICLDNVLDKMRRKHVVDIPRIINKMRNQRMKMVQTLAQYIFIHDAILEAIVCGDTQVQASELKGMLRKPKFVQTQFEVLELVSPKQNEVSCNVALENRDMNRCCLHLPSDRYRVALCGETPDYIHAVFVNSYRQQKAYIIAEGPMQSTTRNMWKVIYERKCDAVVMLSGLVEDDECSWQYWPSIGDVFAFDEYTVILSSEEVWKGCIIRTLHLTNTIKGTSRQVIQFHITCWKPNGVCYNLRTVLDVIEELAKLHRRAGTRPVFVHCSDTVTRSGMFCAIAIAIEHYKREGIVDVFQVVQLLRVHKPGAVPTIENYETVYDAILLYLKRGSSKSSSPIVSPKSSRLVI